MRPTLFHLPDWLGGAGVPSYGVLMILGVVVGSLFFAQIAHWRGRDRGRAFEIMLETILVSMIGSKVIQVLFARPENFEDWLLNTGGVWYAGFLSGVAYFSWRGPRLGFTLPQALDHAVPAVAVGHALGRIGCFLAGCCWGSECTLPWAVTYTSEVASARVGVPLGVPLHPTQLYEAGTEIFLGIVLAVLVVRRHLRFDGQNILTYVIGYAILRIAFESVRSDPRGAVGGLSTSQTIALALLAVAVPLFVLGWRRGSVRELPPPRPAKASETPRGGKRSS